VTAATAAGLAWPLAARLETATPTRRGGLKERMFGPGTAQNRAQSSAHHPGRLRPAGLDPRRPFTGQTGGWTALGKPIPPRFHLNGGALALKDTAKRSGVPGSRGGKLGHFEQRGTGAATPRAAVFVVTWRSRVRDSSGAARRRERRPREVRHGGAALPGLRCTGCSCDGAGRERQAAAQDRRSACRDK
jgi:hypothetical protein